MRPSPKSYDSERSSCSKSSGPCLRDCLQLSHTVLLKCATRRDKTLCPEIFRIILQSAESAFARGCSILLHDFHGRASRVRLESAAYPLRTALCIEMIAGWDSNAEGRRSR